MAEKEEERHEAKVEREAKEEKGEEKGEASAGSAASAGAGAAAAGGGATADDGAASAAAPGASPAAVTPAEGKRGEDAGVLLGGGTPGADAADAADAARAKQAARMIYEKVYDEAVGRYYYYNARDGTSSWDLPPEFGGDDTFLLTPRARELMVLKMDAGTWKTADTMDKDEAARTIQGMYRRRQARRLIVRAVQSMYEKVWDESSARFFYFNKNTGESIWTKPPLLGYYDDVPLTPRSEALVLAAEREASVALAAASKLEETGGGGYGAYGEQQMAGMKSSEPAGAGQYPEIDSDMASVNSGMRSTATMSRDGYLISSDSGGEEGGDFIGQSWESKDGGSFDGSSADHSPGGGGVGEFKMDADMRRRQMLDFLADNDLEDYEDALVDDGFDDMEALLAILEEDIDAVGFTIADKRKLMNAVEKFRATADLEYELSDDDSDLERRDEDEIDAEMGSDAEGAEDEIRKLRGEGSEYSVSEGGYPEGDADLEGVTIETLFPGDGENFPQPGQIVRMHYKAFVKGSHNSFEDSRLRGRVFEFKVDAAQVVPGLDEAVRTLSFGTKAKITLESSVAYGDKGHPPVIPPSSDLIFEVQLIKSYYAERSIDEMKTET
jgi:FK506-binding protein 1